MISKDTLLAMVGYFTGCAANADPNSEAAKTFEAYIETLNKAVQYLEDQKPRVMATDEVKKLKPGDSCWLEVWWEEDGKTGSTMEFCVVAPDWHLYTESSITPLRELKTVWKANYRERYWNVKPAKEEREAAPWAKEG